MGITFPAVELTGWASSILKALFSEPFLYITEAAGFVILVWFAAVLIRKKDVGVFLKYGKIN